MANAYVPAAARYAAAASMNWPPPTRPRMNLTGVLGVVLGLMLLGNPIQGAIRLTILLASFLFVGGIFKAAAAIAHRFDGWGWLLLSGAIDLVLGVMIWRELPMSGLTIIRSARRDQPHLPGDLVAHGRLRPQAASQSSHVSDEAASRGNRAATGVTPGAPPQGDRRAWERSAPPA